MKNFDWEQQINSSGGKPLRFTQHVLIEKGGKTLSSLSFSRKKSDRSDSCLLFRFFSHLREKHTKSRRRYTPAECEYLSRSTTPVDGPRESLKPLDRKRESIDPLSLSSLCMHLSSPLSLPVIALMSAEFPWSLLQLSFLFIPGADFAKNRRSSSRLRGPPWRHLNKSRSEW